MAIFTELPSEIILKVLGGLPIPDLYTFVFVCKHFGAVIKENSSSVYRRAAIYHGWIVNPTCSPSSSITQLEQATWNLYGNQAQLTISSWLEYCKIRWRIDRAWSEPSFPQETVNYCNERPYQRICHEGNAVLISPANHRELGAIEAVGPRLHRAGAAEIEWGEATGELVQASDGFLLFKLRWTHYRVWSHTGSEFADLKESLQGKEQHKARVPWEYFAGLRFVGDIRLDRRCDGIKLKEKCLMMMTGHVTLSIFDLSSPELSSETTSTSSPPPGLNAQDSNANILIASSTIDLWKVDHEGNSLTRESDVGSITCIDFSSKYIFHTTNERLRVISRTTHELVYTINEASWRKVAPGRWSKCISSNTFLVPRPVGVRAWAEEGSPVDEVVHVERGTGKDRKDRPWRWDVNQMVARDGMLVMSFAGGWIVGLPNVEMLVDRKMTLEDVDACWVLDIGAPCSDVLFDGRRIVWNHNRKIVVLNLHSVSDMRVQAGMPIVRLSQRDWTATNATQTMVLTDGAVWFLGGGRNAGG